MPVVMKNGWSLPATSLIPFRRLIDHLSHINAEYPGGGSSAEDVVPFNPGN